MTYAHETILPEEWPEIMKGTYLLKDLDGTPEYRAIDRDSGRWIVEVANGDYRELFSRSCVFVDGETSTKLRVSSERTLHLEVAVRERIGLSASQFREMVDEVLSAVAGLYKLKRSGVILAPPIAANIGWRIKPRGLCV